MSESRQRPMEFLRMKSSMRSTHRRYVQVPEGTLCVLDDGEPGNGAPLVLIHGFGEAAVVWDTMLAILVAERRVLRVDLLGHGGSSKPRTGYDVPRQARAVLGALDRCGVDEAHLVGHSAGGDIVVSILEQAASRVRSATFLGTAPHLGFVQLGASARLMRLPLVGWMLWRGATDSMFRDGLKKVFAPDFPAVPDVYVQSLRLLPYRAYAEGLAALEAYKNERDLCARVAMTHAPKLVVFGERDTWVDPRAADFWGEKTNARVERIDTLGHTHMAEAPEQTGKLILDFVRNVWP